MLLTQEVEIVVGTKAIEHYESLGYLIPKHKDKKGRLMINRGTKIIVKTEHLLKSSKADVKILCDYCQKEIITRKYNGYLKTKNKNQKDTCENCTKLKVKDITLARNPVENVIKLFNDYNFRVINGIDTFENLESRFDIMCDNGHLWNTSVENFKYRKECPECNNAKKWKYADVKRFFDKNGFVLLTEEKDYINMKSNVAYICKCGNIYSKSFYDFKVTPNCPECSKRSEYNTEKVKKLFAEINYTLLSEYENIYSHLEYICDKSHYNNKLNLSNFIGGARCPTCYKENNFGKNHPKWNPDKTIEERIVKRNYNDYYIWRKSVYERDNYICQCCGNQYDHNLNAHHKDGYNWCKERRLDIDNGITLCENCHILSENSFHKIYGNGNNTEQQFNEWINKFKILYIA